MDKLSEFLKLLFTVPEKIRIDGFILYVLGMLYYVYMHRKHDSEIVRGLKGENEMWEAPEAVVYYWLQIMPPLICADAFLGLVMSDGMQYIFTLILFFAIMGRAGVELIPSLKNRMMGQQPEKKKEEETPPA